MISSCPVRLLHAYIMANLFPSGSVNDLLCHVASFTSRTTSVHLKHSNIHTLEAHAWNYYYTRDEIYLTLCEINPAFSPVAFPPLSLSLSLCVCDERASAFVCICQLATRKYTTTYYFCDCRLLSELLYLTHLPIKVHPIKCNE